MFISHSKTKQSTDRSDLVAHRYRAQRPVGRRVCQARAVPTIVSRSECARRQPRRSRGQAGIGDERRRIAGAARRLRGCGTGRPLTRSAAAITSRTEWPCAGAEVERGAVAARRRDARARGHARRRDRRHGCSRGSRCRPGSGSRCRRCRSASPLPSAARRISGIRCVSGSWFSPISPSGSRAGGVEIAQRRGAQTIGPAVPVQRPLDRQLGLAVGVDRRLRRRLSRDRHAGRACRRRRRSRKRRSRQPRPRASRRAARACRRRCCDNRVPASLTNSPT